jgi:lipopolysaccharide/colanic/teichoic acid biosynthesis glycosyltransferase
MGKRAFDICGAFFGLTLFSPLLLAVAACVKMTSPGPALFRQARVGRHGKIFWILKFRTMHAGSERAGPEITVAGDRRITSIGRILRKTKFDELPQLLNILRGEMSFVGPRPEVPKYVQLYTPEQKQVLELMPGITDKASLAFRDEETLLASSAEPEVFYINVCIPKKIELNMDYSRHATVISDFALIIRTVLSVWARI